MKISLTKTKNNFNPNNPVTVKQTLIERKKTINSNSDLKSPPLNSNKKKTNKNPSNKQTDLQKNYHNQPLMFKKKQIIIKSQRDLDKLDDDLPKENTRDKSRNLMTK